MITQRFSKNPDIILNIPQPPSVNACYSNAGKKRVKSKSYINWIKESNDYLIVTGQSKKIRLLKPPYEVIYEIPRYDKRQRDCANYEKPLSDYMKQLSIIEDDRHIIINTQMFVDKKEKIVVCKLFSV